MKKICFFISSITQAGGTGRVCTEIANKLSTLGYRVSILSFYGDTPFFELQPAVKVVPVFDKKYPFKLFLPYVILKLRNRIKKISPDVLINVDAALYLYSMVSGFSLNLKNVVWEHFNFNISLNASVRVRARKLAAKYSDAVVTLTEKDNRNWRNHLLCTAQLITIPNPSPFTARLPDAEHRKQIVLSVGRFTAQKGFDRLLEAWALAIAQTGMNWELHLVGSGALKGEIEAQIEALDIGASVRVLPETTQIEKHYEEASIYAMASRFEGFPMVLLEAQAFALPMISYDCETGPSEIISKKNGILVKNGDVHAMANALAFLMSNKDRRATMSMEAFKSASRYSIDTIIKNWIHLFEVQLRDQSISLKRP